MEIVVLAISVVLPFVLQDYLTIYATRVLILCLFALSFDLVWGYAEIMSFGQAVFFGSAGYGVALIARDIGVTSMLIVLPAGILIGFTFALLLGGLLAARTASGQRHLCCAGHADRVVCPRSLGAGLDCLGGQNGIPSIPSISLGSYDLRRGPGVLLFRAGHSRAGLSLVPLPGRFASSDWLSPACAKMSSASHFLAIACSA